MKKTKIIPLYSKKENSNKATQKYDEEQYDDFEGWEAEASYIDNEDWPGLIEYYKKEIANGQKELCIKVADVYIDIKEYQKAIEFLKPYYEEEPDEEVIRNTINTAQNYIDKKDVVLVRKNFNLMGEADMLRLFYDEYWRKINNKKFSTNLNELFKKYDYISVDIHDNIYGVKNNNKEFLRNEDRAYSIANTLLL